MDTKALILFNTLKYLKPIQIYYQLVYRLKSKLFKNKTYSASYTTINQLNWTDGIHNLETYVYPNTFTFINLNHVFDAEIDWNYNGHKKLWLYNLNYFDYLNQKHMTKTQGLELIKDYVENYTVIKDGKESYPTSLRIINWIKFILKNNITTHPEIFAVLKEDSNRLYSNLEFHLLANHVLENAFALWFSGYFFNDKKHLNKGIELLNTQLNEQILEDGAHFELSPMYHQLMLYRVLDCLQLYHLNPKITDNNTKKLLETKALSMLSWLHEVSYKNGDIPLVNDAANNINPSSEVLFNYAKTLHLTPEKITLKASGYRKLTNNIAELFIDVGNIQPSYQPGHAHADTFHFDLYLNNIPVFIDTGTSTYNIGSTRTKERSTKAHNTVTVNNKDSSQVWSGFRVAKRAKVSILADTNNKVSAVHDGYKNMGIKHQRNWVLSDNRLNINDFLIGKNTTKAKAYFHCHPNIDVIQNKNILTINNYKLEFIDATTITLSNYKYAGEFNTYKEAPLITVDFKSKLTTNLYF